MTAIFPGNGRPKAQEYSIGVWDVVGLSRMWCAAIGRHDNIIGEFPSQLKGAKAATPVSNDSLVMVGALDCVTDGFRQPWRVGGCMADSDSAAAEL